jgi:ABC-type Mn2+/Zn2+ transport system permease subunit
MEHPPRVARRSSRRLGKAVLVLAVLAGCAAVLFGLIMTFANTAPPTEGPLLVPVMLALLAAPVCVAAILVHRILRGGHSGDDDGLLP